MLVALYLDERFPDRPDRTPGKEKLPAVAKQNEKHRNAPIDRENH